MAQQDLKFFEGLKQAEELCNQAEALLQHNQPTLEPVFVALREALELLGDDEEPEAVHIRNRVGAIWLSLIEYISNLNQARTALQEAIELLTLTPLLKIFEDRLELVEIGIELQGHFENRSEKNWGNLLQKDRGKWTWRLERNLSLLEGTDSWEILKDQAKEWRTQLATSILPAYLRPYYETARHQAQERSFEEAYQTADTACQQIPNALAEQLPAEIGQEGLWRMRDVLQERLLVEKNLIVAAKKLRKSGASIEQAFSEIELHPIKHPDVPWDDLLSLLNDLKLAIEIESLLQKQSSVDSYAADIHSYREMAGVELSIRDQPPEFIQRSDPQLAQELQEFILALQKKLTHKQEEAILAMSNRLLMENQFIWPASDPAPFLALFWQLRWCMVSSVTTDLATVTSARTALDKAQQGPWLLLHRALDAFHSMQKHADLVYLQDILKALTKLNIGLSQLIIGGEPAVLLPPIPEGQSLETAPPELDEDALKTWEQVLESWHNNLLESIDFFNTTTYEPTLVKKAGEQDQEFRRDLKKLKNEVWPKLQLPPWGEGTCPDNLEKELSLRLMQVNELQKAGSRLTYRGSLECLERLEELTPLMEKTNPYRPSILDAQSQYLQISIHDLNRQAREKLTSQVFSILQDKTKPAVRLYREILSRPQSARTAEFVYHTVLTSADQLSSEARQTGERDQKNLFWEIIITATESWANPENAIKNNAQLSPEVVTQWQKLNQDAKKAAYRKLPKIQIKRANGAIVALILVLFVAWFGSKAWASRSQEQNRLVAQAVNATKTQIFNVTETFQGEQVIQATQKAATTTAEAHLLAIQQSATAQTAAQNSAATQTAEAFLNAQATAERQTAVAFAPSATSLALEMQLMTESAFCKDPAQYALEVINQPLLYPAPGTKYVAGNAPFDATATWGVKNTGNCNWTNLSIKPLADSQPIPFTFYQDGVATDVTPENPLKMGDQIEVKLDFGVLKTANMDQEWIFVINDLELSDQPPLQLKIEDWIIPVTPRPTSTSVPSKPSSPKSTPKPPSRRSSTATPPPR